MEHATSIPTLFHSDDSLSGYLRKIHSFPMLEQEEEAELATQWAKKKDKKALTKLINSHLRLVAKIASGYRGYGLPLADLIAEGNVGILQATRKFDPDKGYRFSTYARWWIQASIQEYILKSWSLVKIGTTSAQKKLFFNLRKLKHQLGILHLKSIPIEEANIIAKELGVSVQEVEEMDTRLSSNDLSLNKAVGSSDDSNMEWQDWLVQDETSHADKLMDDDEKQKQQEFLLQAMKGLSEREYEVIQGRRLEEPPRTLEALATKFHISKERVRQIEVSAFEKLRNFIHKISQEKGLAFC